jgi:hypothetical protein
MITRQASLAADKLCTVAPFNRAHVHLDAGSSNSTYSLSTSPYVVYPVDPNTHLRQVKSNHRHQHEISVEAASEFDRQTR